MEQVTVVDFSHTTQDACFRLCPQKDASGILLTYDYGSVDCAFELDRHDVRGMAYCILWGEKVSNIESGSCFFRYSRSAGEFYFEVADGSVAGEFTLSRASARALAFAVLAMCEVL